MATTKTALITGGSRGIGAATAIALAHRNYDVAITYRNKAARAEEVVTQITRLGRRGLAIGADLSVSADVRRLAATVSTWTDSLQALILNASGGLERDRIVADPSYPMRINRDAQLTTLDAMLPLVQRGGSVIFITSHWAHLYGRIQQLPTYEPVARSKHAGEQALRARGEELDGRGVRLLIVTGDLIEGTITPRLLERSAPGMVGDRRALLGRLPHAEDLGEAVAASLADESLPSGFVVVVGGALDTLS